MTTKIRTVDFLPEIFRTESNRQFLDATLDILTAQPNLKKVQGYVGAKYGYGINPSDKYIVEPSESRSDYQLEPSVVFLKSDTQTAQDFISYPGLIDAITNAGGITNNHNRLFDNEFYSWDPFVDLDKLVNYSQYYWLPKGPDAIPLTVSNDAYINTQIVGQKTFTAANGLKFTNGLKISFTVTSLPTPPSVSPYNGKSFYVEGVGDAIVLLPITNFIVPEPYGQLVFNPWDLNGWDMDNWDADLYISVNTEYITISRNSADYNAWTRANRWFHQDVIDTTAKFLGPTSNTVGNTATRASRPIVEFRGNLQLFNTGKVGLPAINYLDTVTTNAIASVVGQSTYTVDGRQLLPGDRVLFAVDNTESVRRTIYKISLSSNNTFLLTPDSTIIDNDSQTVVLSGNVYNGTTWRYVDDTITWVQCQQKNVINQPPLYDVFSYDKVTERSTSLSNPVAYPGTTFAGSKLFSYTISSAAAPDPILGFPLTYSGVNNIGDINFTVNLNSDEFSYVDSTGKRVSSNINIGFVHQNINSTIAERLTGWIKAAGESVQYQTFSFKVTETYKSYSSEQAILADVNNHPVGTYYYDIQTGYYFKSVKSLINNKLALENVTATFHRLFVLDVPVKTTNTTWTTVQVYVNDNILSNTDFQVTVSGSKTTVLLEDAAETDSIVTILADSDVVSSQAYYSIPSNLQNNPFNTNITSVDVGDLRNQYRTIFANAPEVSGKVFGNNNIHDLSNLNKYGTAIIQNSASLVLPGLFMRRGDVDFFSALQYNSTQYQLYKDLLIDIAGTSDYSIQQTPQEVLDNIVYQITTIKSNSKSFFWTDMLPSGSASTTKTYSIGVNTTSVVYNLTNIYDTTRASYFGLSIYRNRIENGISRQKLLIRGIDYTVSATSATVTLHTPLLAGDTITIKEYNQTYGSYCPSTPTSLGLYPATIPHIMIDNGARYIVGHDGSISKLYGPYIDGQLQDFRDIALLEFETRVYNNIKTDSALPLTTADVISGQFRKTEYTWQETLDIYRPHFLNWVGANKLDYRTQRYNQADQFSYNYGQSSNKLFEDCQDFDQGYWRGIYKYFYDTEDPAATPWEMLGHANKPSWWDTYYSWTNISKRAALLSAIQNGRTEEPPSTVVNPLYARPEITRVIPVDTNGTLLNPFDSVVGNYNKLTFKRDWVVGDGSPVEATYWKNSAWPFDAIRILALTKPAKFFNLFADLDSYRYDSELQQYMYNERYHLDPRILTVYGNGTAVNSYINWIVDYVYQRGVNGYDVVSTYLKNLDVRLAYRLAGFSAKDYLKFYIERATPNSKNTSLLVPDENYSVLLYNNVPQETIRYSSVVLQKTSSGWAVYGNSTATNYFRVSVANQNGKTDIISGGGATVKVNLSYTNDTVLIPYGTVFYSQQAVADFIAAYGHYLETQGVKFEVEYNSTVYNWSRMVQEYLIWAQQSWEIGSTISLNPSAKNFVVNRENLVVQPLTLYDKNFILNQNLLPVQQQNASIYRNNTQFTVKITNEGDTVAYTNLNLSCVEHAVVYDNFTSFNDTIYNLVTGLRQNRLLLKGYKTAEWKGYVDSNGFILSEDNIPEWKPGLKYPKGSIVQYKDSYWIANQLIEPASIFPQNLWQTINYDRIKFGLLPNPSTQSVESTLYYNSNVANLELDTDLLAFGLIGYRPRDYLNAADLTDITQINVYKNIIREKGTYQLANGFKFAQFDQGQIDYDIYENWALNMASFGAVLASNFLEARLDQHKLIGNPTIIGFTKDANVEYAQQTVKISELVNWERPPLDQNFLPAYKTPYNVEIGLPTAGYVNENDVKFKTYQYRNIFDDQNTLSKMYVNDSLWIANHKNSWAVLTAQSTQTQVVNIENNFDGTIGVTFAGFHNLQKQDAFTITDFDDTVNNFYYVKNVDNPFKVTTEAAVPSNVVSINGLGIALKLSNARFAQASDLAEANIFYNGLYTRKAWVDHMPDNSWAVLESKPIYKDTNWSTTINAGSAVAYSDRVGYLLGNAKTWTVYQAKNNNESASMFGVTPGFGKIIKVCNSAVIIASDDYVYYYTLNSEGALTKQQQIDVQAMSISVSEDAKWLYIGTTNSVVLYHLNSGQYVLANTINAPAGATGFGFSCACSIDGVKLVVGAPYQSVQGLQNSGAVYVYNREYRRYLVSVPQLSFALRATPPNNQLDVYVNGIEVTNWTLNGSVVTFTTSPPTGSIVTITTGRIQTQQTITSSNYKLGGNFGFSVSTNRFGSDFVVGAPNETTTVQNTSGVEGCVYKYTNGGQRYGTLISESPRVLANDFISINGFGVTFAQSSTNLVYIADAINTQTPTNIVATVSGTNLVITVLALDDEVVYNYLDLVATVPMFLRLKITPYVKTQNIYSYNLATTAQFGHTVVMDEQDGLVVSAPSAPKVSITSFDYTADDEQNDTIIDSDATTFIESIPNIGCVYQYQYLPANNESTTNPGKYVFGQLLNCNATISSNQPRFGTSLAYRNGVIVAGSVSWYGQNQGQIVSYSSTTTDSTWNTYRVAANVVDINRVNNISIYDSTNNETLGFLDYFDPYQGKLLGAIASNIDYIGFSDPAGYTTETVQWGVEHVGTTWFNTTNFRLYNYYQSDLAYNAKKWGLAFPGSTADVYTWIESLVEPINYVGPGVVSNLQNYSVGQVYDRSINGLATRYYFWVKDLDSIPVGKTLSPIVLSSYLINPLNSGISYLAPLTTNVIALFNSSSYIQDVTSILHIGYGNTETQDTKHTAWDLVRAGDSGSFLAGLPNALNSEPSGTYLKYIDSFCGVDSRGYAVPDLRLPAILRSGINFRPRQSMFINRTLALKNYITYANNIMLKYPIAETTNLSFIQKFNDVNGSVIKQSVTAATTVNLQATYSNGINGVGATLIGTGILPNIDEVSLSIGNRILVKNQAAAIQNGIYVVTATNSWVLTRATDFNGSGSGEVQNGDSVLVTQGITQANTKWTVQSPGNVVFGVTQIEFDEFSGTDFITTARPIYDVRDYWTYVDWWATGYSSSTKPIIEVETYNDLTKISDNTIVTGVNGLIITLDDGLIARVRSNSQAAHETYVYRQADNTWIRIGLQNGTLKFSDSLWINSFGFDWTGWSNDIDSWDKNASTEIRWIIRWINEYLYNEELISERNKSLILMFNYIKSESIDERNYGQWLMKTSFIDVSHNIRKLIQYKKYQRDNIEFLTGFINEIKPYHVYVKDFIYKYDGEDIYQGNVTDFDLPAQYNSVTGKFESPQLVYKPSFENNEYLPTNKIWTEQQYNQWFSNYGLHFIDNKTPIEFTKLQVELAATQSTMTIQTVTGLENTGIVQIGSEIISYNGIDARNKRLLNLIRGFNQTTVQSHASNSVVMYYVNPFVVVDGGRGYNTAPTINISINTANYPTPRVAATATALIQNGSVVSVNATNVGSGYATDPTITISGSSITASFSGSAINTTNNTITITGHPFVTGDPVVFSSTANRYGLTVGSYYYVAVLGANTIALYTDINAAKNVGTVLQKRDAADAERVKLSNAGTQTVSITVTARVATFLETSPIRSMKTRVLFDRVSFKSDALTSNTAAERILALYKPTIDMPGVDLPQLMIGLEYPNQTVDALTFSENPVLDAQINPNSSPLTFTSPDTLYSLSGGDFPDGYSPEELVAGVITDALQIVVTHNDLQPSNEIGYVVTLDNYSGTISSSLPIYTNQLFNNVPLTGGSGTGARANVRIVVEPGVTTVYGPGASSTNVYIDITTPTGNNYNSYTVGDTLTLSGALLGGTSPANDITVRVATVGGKTWKFTQTVNRFGIPVVYAGGNTAGSPLDNEYYNQSWYRFGAGWNAESGWSPTYLPWDHEFTPNGRLTVSQHPAAIFLRTYNQ